MFSFPGEFKIETETFFFLKETSERNDDKQFKNLYYNQSGWMMGCVYVFVKRVQKS